MTLPTVPLIVGTFYWCKRPGSPNWEVAQYDCEKFWLPGHEKPVALAVISGRIPTPDGEGE